MQTFGEAANLEMGYAAVAECVYYTPPFRHFLFGEVYNRIAVRSPPRRRRHPTTILPRPVGGHMAPDVTATQSPGIAALPDGWHHIRAIDLTHDASMRVQTLKGVPRCIRGQFLRIMHQCLHIVEMTHRAQDRHPEATFKLCMEDTAAFETLCDVAERMARTRFGT